MPNNKSITNENSDLVKAPCPTNQSEDFDMAIDKDELIANAKTFIDGAKFDFDKNPISETCRFLSLKNMVVTEPRDRYNASKEIADIIEKVFDDYLANEISKREKTLLEKKVVKKKDFCKPILTNVPREDAIAAVKKLAVDYIYSTKWVEHRDPAAEYEKLQHLESQARDEVIRLYGLDDELLDTVSSEFKEFYKYHPTIFFPTKPSERTCEDKDVFSSVKKLATERLELFKFQANEDPEDAYTRLRNIEIQAKNEVTSLYGQDTALLDIVSRVFDDFYEVHRYSFVTGNKEPQEITDPVCASEDADEKDETMELACDAEDTDAKPEESPEEELVDIEYALTPDKKTAKVTEIANECVNRARFRLDDGKLVKLLRVLDAERKAASRVYELYGEDKDAIEELSKFFKSWYESVERLYDYDFKEKALVVPEPAGMTEILDRIYNSLSRIVKECMSGTGLEYNDGSDYDVTLIQNVEHNIKSKVTEMFGDNKAIQSFANDIFRDRLAEAPKVESTTVPAESSGKEDCTVKHVVITDEEKVAVANKIANDCVGKINFSHDEGEAVELLRMFEAEREATSKVVEVYGDDKVALDAIHEIFNCLYENIKQFYEGEPKEACMVRIDDPTHEEKANDIQTTEETTEINTNVKYELSSEDIEKVNQYTERFKAKEDGMEMVDDTTHEKKVEDITKIAKESIVKCNFDKEGDIATSAVILRNAECLTTDKVKELYNDDADALKIVKDLFTNYFKEIGLYNLNKLSMDKIKQSLKSKTEEVFGIGNEDAINAVLDIFDTHYSWHVGKEAADTLINKAILNYIAKEAVEYSGLRLSENKSDEQIHMFEAKKEAIEKAKEIYGDDKELLDYVAKEVESYATAIAATLQLQNMGKKKQNRPMPIITKPIGRRIPGMSHVVQTGPLTVLGQNSQTSEPSDLHTEEESNVSGKDIENLITKIYGERSRKNLPKEPQEQSEQKEYPVFFDTTMSLGLARRIWKEQNCDGSVANIVEPLLDGFYPDKEYQRPYKYGAVVLDEIVSGQVTDSSYADSKKLNCFCSILKYYNNWIDNYYGQDVKREESDLKFSIHRVHPEPDKYDYVVIENSHSTRPLSFPTKDMAHNFLITFRDLIEAAGNLI